MIPESATAEFWAVVQECLVSFFDFDGDKAAQEGLRLRESAEPLGEIFYHGEPYEVACDIARREPSNEHLDKYHAILGEHQW